MTIVELDAADWRTPLDFYDAILAALGAPEWHGRSTDALVDSMIYGEINAVDQPVRVEVHGLDRASNEACGEFRAAVDHLVREGAICRISSDGRASIEVTWPLSRGCLQTT